MNASDPPVERSSLDQSSGWSVRAPDNSLVTTITLLSYFVFSMNFRQVGIFYALRNTQLLFQVTFYLHRVLFVSASPNSGVHDNGHVHNKTSYLNIFNIKNLLVVCKVGLKTIILRDYVIKNIDEHNITYMLKCKN